MTDEKPAEPKTSGAATALRGIGIALVVFLLLVGAVAGGAAATCYGTSREEDKDTTVIRPTTDVITAVRDLARLEGAEYHVERVIDLADRQERLFGLVQAQDAILLVAAGDVVAGIDLSQMRDGDVEVDLERRTARIVLPRPQVFSARLDSQRTYVHTRSTDVLARERQDLETRARQEAERTIQQAAVEGGILDRAKDNAGRTVETLVRSLGYRPEITWAAE